jgi:hypothetical protein
MLGPPSVLPCKIAVSDPRLALADFLPFSNDIPLQATRMASTPAEKVGKPYGCIDAALMTWRV